jgi:hypothetical protein
MSNSGGKDGCRVDSVAERPKGGSRHRDESRRRSGDPLSHRIDEGSGCGEHGPVFQCVDEAPGRPLVSKARHADQTRADRYLRGRTQLEPTSLTKRFGTRHGAAETEHAPDCTPWVGQKAETPDARPLAVQTRNWRPGIRDWCLFYVPSSQDSRYLACSSVRVSSDAPIASSLRRATDSSSSRGRTYTSGARSSPTWMSHSAANA